MTFDQCHPQSVIFCYYYYHKSISKAIPLDDGLSVASV